MAGTRTEQLDTVRLPRSLRLIAEYCGEACMWAVWQQYGGGHLSVPATVYAAHPIWQKLGESFALSLAAAFPSETLFIAKFDRDCKIARLQRNQQIIQQRADNMTHFEIARRHGLTERQVINILNEAKQPSVNFDIFEE